MLWRNIYIAKYFQKKKKKKHLKEKERWPCPSGVKDLLYINASNEVEIFFSRNYFTQFFA